jgi:hypothetical protein
LRANGEAATPACVVFEDAVVGQYSATF